MIPCVNRPIGGFAIKGMESPVGVKGRKWQAADDSVNLKRMKL